MHVSASVSDLLFDGTGKIIGMVGGLGGFLRIGTKNVAIDVSAFNLSRSIPAVTTTTLLQATRTNPSNVKLEVAWTKTSSRTRRFAKTNKGNPGGGW